MSANSLSLDDTNNIFRWSPGWAVPASEDPNRSRYFQGTYHGTSTVGANVTFAFRGSSVHIYGSKGPNHGSWTAQVDNKVAFLSAFSPEPQFQQLLFSLQVDQGDHQVVFSNRATEGEAGWLDVDYVVLSLDEAASSSSISSAPMTIAPIPTKPPNVNGIPGSLTDSPTSSVSSSATSSPSNLILNTPAIIAIVLGVLLFILLVFMTAYFFLRRHRHKLRSKEREFRRGMSVGTRTNTPGPGSPQLIPIGGGSTGSTRTVMNLSQNYSNFSQALNPSSAQLVELRNNNAVAAAPFGSNSLIPKNHALVQSPDWTPATTPPLSSTYPFLATKPHQFDQNPEKPKSNKKKRGVMELFKSNQSVRSTFWQE